MYINDIYKGKNMRTVKAKVDSTRKPCAHFQLLKRSVSTVGGVGVRGLLPLSLEMVGTENSQLTMWALCVLSGWWAGKQRRRAVEWFEDLVLGEITCLGEFVLCGLESYYLSWVAHGPTMVELWSRA